MSIPLGSSKENEGLSVFSEDIGMMSPARPIDTKMLKLIELGARLNQVDEMMKNVTTIH